MYRKNHIDTVASEEQFSLETICESYIGSLLKLEVTVRDL